MIRNYYTIKKVVQDIQSLNGFFITEIFTQEKDVLTLECEMGAKREYLILNCESQDSSIYFKKKFSRAKKNTLNIFDALIGHTIKSIDLIKCERIVKIDLGAYKLIAYIFGGAKSNVFLIDTNGVIIDAFKNKKDFLGKDLVINLTKSNKLSSFDKNELLINALGKCNLNIGKYYALELLKRLNIDIKLKISEISDDDLINIEKSANTLINEIESSDTCFIGLTQKQEMLLSLINISSITEIKGEYKDLSNAILRRIVNKTQRSKFDVFYLELFRKLDLKQKRIIQSIKESENIKLSIERSAKYKLWAESLLCGADMQLSGLECVTRELWDGEQIDIPLNKNLSVAENANKYFEKSKKTAEEARARGKLKIKLESELIKIKSLISELEATANIDELEKIKIKMSETANINSGDKSENAKKFREFDLGDGYILYVGKNAANNDELIG